MKFTSEAASALYGGSNVRLILSLGSLFMADVDDAVNDSLEEESIEKEGEESNPKNSQYLRRSRHLVNQIFRLHGPYYSRRAYRMSIPSFWRLHALLHPLLFPPDTRPAQRQTVKLSGTSTQTVQITQ